jgi:hypothetical protein
MVDVVVAEEVFEEEGEVFNVDFGDVIKIEGVEMAV